MRTVAVKDVVIGAGAPAVVVPLVAPDLPALLRAARELQGHAVDVVEWRVDHLTGDPGPSAVVAAAGELVPALGGRPLLLTLRTSAEGGERALPDGDYAEILLAVARSGVADLVDVELLRGGSLVREVVGAAHAAGVAVVGSSHDFAGTPPRDEIVARLRRMHGLGADVAKVAVMPHDPGDVLTLLEATWVASRDADRPVVTMAMGGKGLVSRLAGEVFGSAATFAMVGRASAPGQVDVEELARVLALVHRSL